MKTEINFNNLLKTTNEYGIVEEVNHPIIKISGLPGAKIDEIIILESGEKGRVVALTRRHVETVIFSKYPVKTGIKAARTNEHLDIPVGVEFLGCVIDPLGNLIFENNKFKMPQERRDVDQKPLTIEKRCRIDKQLTTGITLIDLLLPLGQGQRELVVGDRKTGKTSIFLNMINNQIKEGDLIVYAIIGKKSIDIKSLKEYLEKKGLLEKTVIIATTSEDSPSLVDLTPYSAMTMAEYFRDSLKKDVLVILDDLTGHAKYYRELSLLSKRFPGRDSYPGDIFFKHARLLERAGNFKVEDKEVSITCLPVAETTQGNLTDYIVSNLISITDGHILFDVNVFNKGIRPAVNVFLSVTRVGKQTQDRLSRDINRFLFSFLIRYDRAQRFSHFGAELSKNLKDTLTKGNLYYKFFEQKYDVIIPKQIQQIGIGIIMEDLFINLKGQEIPEKRDLLVKKYNENTNVKAIIDEITKAETFKEMRQVIVANKDKLREIMDLKAPEKAEVTPVAPAAQAQNQETAPEQQSTMKQ